MINKKNKKRISILVLVLFANQLFFPSISFATGGTQPEFSRFVPYDSSQLVNPFTGDFTYNIPLLNVPGPGGGYPVNIAYSSGITADQEASWVGLGWTLNPGSMDRQTRGIPDDFDGDQKVIKEKHMKPNQTVIVGVGAASSEIFGFDISKLEIPNVNSASLNVNLTVNNYTGYKFGLGLGFSKEEVEGKAVASKSAMQLPSGSFDSPVPLTIRRGSWKQLSKEFLKKDMQNRVDNIQSNIISGGFGAIGAGILFAGASSETSEIHVPMRTYGFEFTGKIGGDLLGFTGDIMFSGSYKSSNYSKDIVKMDAYGYMHSQAGLDKTDEGYAIMDYYRSKNTALNQYTKYLAVPVLTHDLFVANGHTVSGSFRPSLGNVQLLQSPELESTSNSGGFGVEFNSTDVKSLQIGVNANGSSSYSRSGFWSGGRNNIYSHLEKPFSREGTFEPWTFMEMGKTNPYNWSNSPFMDNYSAQKFGLGMEFTGTSFKAKVFNSLNKPTSSSRTALGNNIKRTNRLSKTGNLIPWTGHNLYNFRFNNGLSYYEIEDGNGALNVFQYENNSLIQRLELENGNGKHVYGIPVYVNKQDKRLFSVDPSNTHDFFASNTVDFTITEDGPDNISGRGQLFESETFDSKYPGRYLLTEILSTNYVDVDNNGPSESDFGYYTLFEYKRAYENFRTYSPPRASSNTRVGYYSVNSLADEKDDVCNYTVTNSEQYYLKKIETKTHYALFTSSSNGRNDDYGYGTNGSPINREKLEKIELFKKGDLTDELLKTIEFEYYANGAMIAAPGNSNSKAGTTGKLLLKNIRVKSGEHNTKVYLNPYEFTYHEISGHVYQPTQKDAWGYYQPAAVNEYGSVSQFTEVNQKADYTNPSGQNPSRNEIASLYNLKTIELPTGGIIEVNYEQDDYQYVQDEKARTQYEIAGFGSIGNFDLSSNAMYVKLKEPVTTQAEMEALVQTILPQDQYIPFKAAVRLRKKPVTSNVLPQWVEPDGSGDDQMMEYISGYLQVNSATFIDVNCEDQCNYEYIKVNLKGKDLSNLNSTIINPIRYAAFEHLFSSPMLILDGFDFDVSLNVTDNDALRDVISGVISLAKGAKNTKDAFFVEANSKGYAGAISTLEKSVIALNAQNGRKYGGGTRVSSIKTKDNWENQTTASGLISEKTFDMVQEYSYELTDGTSSGVTSYEPGGISRENPLIKPNYMGRSRGVLNSSTLMVEGPRMEAFFPSPSVGYSRIVMSKRPVETDGSAIDQYSRSSDGTLIQEFFTAKDFPTIERKTEIELQNVSPAEDFTRFIGLKSYFHPGYSQGYAIELNNMHGKPKQTSTYGANISLNEPPSASTIYEYHTKIDTETKKEMVQSEVDVLLGDGQVETQELGVGMDAYIEMQEAEEKRSGGDIAANIEIFTPTTLPIIIPVAIPSVDNYHTLTRQIITTKVITRNGILKKVITQQDGRTIEAENLLHDAENGNVLLTRVTNDFNAPIYTYNRPMHWLDNQYGATYQNSFALVTSENFQQVLTPGDWISNLDGNAQYRVQRVTSWSATLEDENGTTTNSTFLDGPYIILESGYVNGTGNIYSEITSLKDPTNSSNRQFELFEKTTELDASFNLLNSWQELTNCDGDKIVFCFSDDPAGECVLIRYTIGEDANLCDIEFAYASDPSKTAKIESFSLVQVPNFTNYSVSKIGTTARLELNGGGTTYNLTWSDPLNLFPECLDAGVLNASFTTSALGEEVLKLPQASNLTQQEVFNDRPAFYGLKNSKYPQYNLTYFAQRNQSEAVNPTAGFFDTDVSADGTYRNYIDYNHQSTPELNAPWVLGSEFTAFDFHGHALEQKDALGIYSSQIMDQHNLLVLAKGLNARQDEVCFQSFEGYATGNQSMKDGNFTFSADVNVINTAAHTGVKAVSLSSGNQIEFEDLDASTTYRLSFWSQQSSLNINGQTENASIINVDGWNLFHLDYNSSAAGEIYLSMNQNTVLDDIALRPIDGSMTAYVYDAEDLKLLAQFDDQHFATIYGYDDEDNLSFVKKETEEGIHTLSNYMTNKAQ